MWIDCRNFPQTVIMCNSPLVWNAVPTGRTDTAERPLQRGLGSARRERGCRRAVQLGTEPAPLSLLMRPASRGGTSHNTALNGSDLTGTERAPHVSSDWSSASQWPVHVPESMNELSLEDCITTSPQQQDGCNISARHSDITEWMAKNRCGCGHFWETQEWTNGYF